MYTACKDNPMGRTDGVVVVREPLLAEAGATKAGPQGTVCDSRAWKQLCVPGACACLHARARVHVCVHTRVLVGVGVM